MVDSPLVRRLLPLPATDDVDVEACYAVPDRPHVRANMVASVDGAAWAGPEGDAGDEAEGVTAGLSDPADRRVFHVLRGLADAVLVGATTVRREGYGPARPSAERRVRRRSAGLSQVPPIVVVSRSLALDPGARLFTAAEARPVVVTVATAPAGRRTALEAVADVVVAGERDVEMAAALDLLAARGLRRVLCEGGPTLLAAVAAAGRLDELCLTLSPQLRAGTASRIVDGPALRPACRLALAGVLEQNGALLLRYTAG